MSKFERNENGFLDQEEGFGKILISNINIQMFETDDNENVNDNMINLFKDSIQLGSNPICGDENNSISDRNTCFKKGIDSLKKLAIQNIEKIFDEYYEKHKEIE